jgi:GntR family transcriptional regulator / MocR family aminotransferase
MSAARVGSAKPNRLTNAVARKLAVTSNRLFVICVPMIRPRFLCDGVGSVPIERERNVADYWFYSKVHLSIIFRNHFDTRDAMGRIASTWMSTLAVPDFDAREPLNRQIYGKLRDAILDGRIAPGAQIPSSRELAREFGIGRNTVVSAVEQLITEGYLQGERGSGTYVNRTLPEERTRVSQRSVVRAPSTTRQPPLPRRIQDLKAVTALLPAAGKLKPFMPCVPAVDAFPFALWGKLVQKQWRQHAGHLLGLGEAAGYLPLRRAIAEYLASARAVNCVAEQVIVVSGAQQALDLVSRVVIEAGDAVWIEDPGYQGIRATLTFAGAKLVPVPVDEEGLQVQVGRLRAPSARMAYVTPSHQFPLGHTMSLARRLDLLAWSRDTGAWILEDDYDSEYRYTSRPIPALQGLARDDQVLYVGSLSKVLYPSLRLGYLVVPQALVESFALTRTLAAGAPTLIDQAVLTEFITAGHFARHIRRMRTLYQQRRAALCEAASRELGGLLEIHAADAGLHAIGWAQPGSDDQLMCQRASAAGIDCLPISKLYHGPQHKCGLVLGFAPFDTEQIDSAMGRLAQALTTFK